MTESIRVSPHIAEPVDGALQIELIGCTSSGKSRLSQRMRNAKAPCGFQVLTSDELILRHYRLNWINPRLARTVLIDIFCAFECAKSWARHREYHRLAIRVIRSLRRGTLEKLNLVRNALKKIGVYELVGRIGAPGQIVIVDEGTLHAAHNLFVHSESAPEPSDFDRFIEVVPLPAVALLVEQDASVLVERILRRGHSRLPEGSRAHAERFVAQALHVFERLAQAPSIQEHILVFHAATGDRSTRGTSPPLRLAESLQETAGAQNG